MGKTAVGLVEREDRAAFEACELHTPVVMQGSLK
jgi:hypothetical protein